MATGARARANDGACSRPGGSDCGRRWGAIEPREASGQPAAPSIIVERVAVGIEIELIGGRRVRFDRDIDPEIMKRVVSALEGSGP